MSAAYGYTFYFDIDGDLLTFPITPGELSITVGSNNKVVTLISEGDVNILKSPSLTEVEFEARFPMRKYPYSRQPSDFVSYFDKLKKLKEDKKSFRFIVARETVAGKRTWDTNLLVSLEEMEIKESSDEGDDVLINFKLTRCIYFRQRKYLLLFASFDFLLDTINGLHSQQQKFVLKSVALKHTLKICC